MQVFAWGPRKRKRVFFGLWSTRQELIQDSIRERMIWFVWTQESATPALSVLRAPYIMQVRAFLFRWQRSSNVILVTNGLSLYRLGERKSGWGGRGGRGGGGRRPKDQLWVTTDSLKFLFGILIYVFAFCVSVFLFVPKTFTGWRKDIKNERCLDTTKKDAICSKTGLLF